MCLNKEKKNTNKRKVILKAKEAKKEREVPHLTFIGAL